jgi:prolyl-tRNA synthetase
MTSISDEKKHSLGITPRSENYAEWYTDVVKKAELADYSPVKGAMVIRPYGYAIWENIQRILDKMFRDTGHQNAYFPLFIPLSFLQKEAEHVEGFSPELAIVTMGGGKQLDEPLVVRPTSETIINAMFARWVQSRKDLPLLYNQWCNVVRWELRPRPFLRTTEFLWQEGHTAHATREEAEAETQQMLDVYVKFAKEHAALSVVEGQKSDSERFAGAVRTYTIEAMMGDRRALQSATSHFLGQNFAKAFGIQYRNAANQPEYVWQTSWGLSTRMIGAIVMAHGDDRGLILPPEVAPYQVVIIPIVTKDDERSAVMEAGQRLLSALTANGLRVKLDDRDYLTSGFKFNYWELKGVPVRIELGPKEVAEQRVTVFRRDTMKKTSLPLTAIDNEVTNILRLIQSDLLRRNSEFREQYSTRVDVLGDLFAMFSGEGGAGFAISFHCGRPECDARIKDEVGVTNRCFPLALRGENGPCIVCGATEARLAMFARAY